MRRPGFLRPKPRTLSRVKKGVLLWLLIVLLSRDPLLLALCLGWLFGRWHIPQRQLRYVAMGIWRKTRRTQK